MQAESSINIERDLNPVQAEAVRYSGGPHLVIAGAGSGKTRVLTYKIAWLISQGVPSSRILALTFTNKAAREMRERIYRLIGADEARYLTAGTFHSVFARILRQEGGVLGYTHDYTIYDTADSKSLIKKITKDLNLDDKIYKPALLLNRISEAKNSLVSAREYNMSHEWRMRDNTDRLYRMGEVYQVYQQRLRATDAMDFDDILFNMYILLSEHPETRDKYHDIFRYILVDEYQDTNHAQYMIIKALCAPSDVESEQGRRDGYICVVGDDAQSIYGFRGADIRNILHFTHEYPNCRLFKLERNYRSTKNIVGAAGSLIKKNRNQISKEVYSDRQDGLPVVLKDYSDDRGEASGVCRTLMLCHRDGRSYDDMAVLYRTNAQSRVLEDELRKNSVPYRIYGGVSFYQRKEVKDVLAYFRLICNTRDDESLLRIINLPARKLGDTTMDKVRQCAIAGGVPLFSVVSDPQRYALAVNNPTAQRLTSFAAMITELRETADTADAYTFADAVLTRSGLRTTLMLGKTAEERDQWDNVQELVTALQEFVSMQQQTGDSDNIRAFLAEVALLTDQDEHSDDCPRVTLMTIHAAKGLEYGVVCIVGLEENLFPSPFCETEREMEEERRLLYVAITRAEDECHLSWAHTRFRNGAQLYQTQSRFLRDIDRRYMQAGPQRPLYSATPAGTGFNMRFSESSQRLTRSGQGGSRLTAISTGGGINETGREPAIPPFPIGSHVRHAVFGTGILLEAYKENGTEKLKVQFGNEIKTMIQKFAKLTLAD